MKILKIKVYCFVHATENIEKVRRAVKTILNNESLIEKEKIEKLTGHHGNPIIHLKYNITNRETAGKIFEKIMASLSKKDKQKLKNSLKLRISRNKLFIRFSKREAYNNKLKISDKNEAIKLEISFKAEGKENLAQYIQKMI